MKKRDLAFVLIFPLIVFILIFIFNLRINYFESLILILFIPSLYLSIRDRNKVKKVFIFSILASIPLYLIWELVCVGDNAWFVPNSIIQFRLFGFMPTEDYIWMFFVTYMIIIFYEHFCNLKFQPRISKRINIMNYILYSLAAVLSLIFIFDRSLLVIPYSYLWAGIIFFIIPCTIFLSRYSKFILNFFKVSAFFFYIHLILELVGLKLNLWTYPGMHYIGWVSFLGLRFPIEEFLFVVVFGGLEALSYYEFFTNRKL